VAVAVVGGQLFRSPDRLVVVPFVSPSAVPSESRSAATPEPTPTPAPSPSPTPTASGTLGVPVPNGPLIVYASVKGHVDVFTLDPATGRRVTMGTLQQRNTFTGQSIQWSTDRRHAIVFDSTDSAQAIVDVQARSIDRLNLPSAERDVVAPAGDRVASLEGSTVDGLTLLVWNLDGDELVNRPLPEIREGQLRMFWAPDGSSLLVNGCGPCDPSLKEPAPGQHYHLFRIPIDGGPIQPLLDEPDWVGAAAWSPDGTMIAFEGPCSTDPCAEPGLGVVRVADGVVTKQLTVGNDSQPVWSPDGRQIAFVRFGGDAGGIYITDADGSNVRRLTTSSTAEGAGDRNVHWSPDGRFLLFSRIDPDFGDLYIVAVTGGKPRLLVKNAVADW
jgi:WD40 repeat protein